MTGAARLPTLAGPPAGQHESGCAEQKPVERSRDGPKRKAPSPWGRGGSERITGCECSTRAVYSIRKRVSTSLFRKQALASVRCWDRTDRTDRVDRTDRTERRAPITKRLCRSVAAGGFIDEPLKEGFRGGGDLVQGVAEQAAEGEGEAAGVSGARFRGEIGAAVEEVADGVDLVGAGQAGAGGGCGTA